MKFIAFVAISISILTGCSLVPSSWKHAAGQVIELATDFTSVAGLFVENDVAVRGMPVGRVTKISPQGSTVQVKFTVDSDIKVPANATAVIVNSSIVTTRHIELVWDAETSKKEQILREGGTIKKSKAPVEISAIFNSVGKLLDEFKGGVKGTGPVADFVNIIDGTTKDGQSIMQALDALSRASKVGADSSDELSNLIRKVADISTILVDNYPKLTEFSSSIAGVSELLGKQSVGLVAVLGDLNATLTNTTNLLSTSTATISGATGRLAALLKNLGDYSRQVVEAIDIAPLLLQNLANSVSAEEKAVRFSALTDKVLLDGELLGRVCIFFGLDRHGCRNGRMKNLPPELGIFNLFPKGK